MSDSSVLCLPTINQPIVLLLAYTHTIYYAQAIILSHCSCTSGVVYVHAQSDLASSPLGIACRKNQLEVVKVLIENGAMVNYRDKVCLYLIMAKQCYCTCAYVYIIGWMDRSS